MVDIRNKFKRKIKIIFGSDEKTLDNNEMLSKWQSKFNNAYTSENKYDDLELTYRGTKETTRDPNSKAKGKIDKTSNVPNIVYENIESEVDTSVPDPIVKSKEKMFEQQAIMLEEKIFSDFNDLGISDMSDINERDTYIFGLGAELITWNSTLGSHKYIGEIELIHYHPKQVITQRGVHKIQKMDYFFLMSTPTKESVRARYGVDVESESETYTEINSLREEKQNTESELVTEIACYYKDEDRDIGKFVWVGDTVVENLPKLYYPRVMKCNECDFENAQGSKKCKCGHEKLTEKVRMVEVIDKAMKLQPLSYTTSVNEVQEVKLDNGETEETIERVTKTVIVKRNVPKGTEIPIPAPKRFPLAIRINVPQNFSFAGRSDVTTIKDQQEAVKKIFSKAMDKILKSGSAIKMRKGMNWQPSNDTLQIIEGTIEQLASIDVQDFTLPIDDELKLFNVNVDIARNTLGITPSFRGDYDPSARSGIAKQKQIDQTRGRLDSKFKNKMSFYSDLFKSIGEFNICFTNENRPYITKDSKGNNDYKEFNKYELLTKDDDGKWYYNTDFIFKAEMNANLPSDKSFLYEQLVATLQFGGVTKEQFWRGADKLGSPIAKSILADLQNEQSELEEIMLAMKGLSPEQLAGFMQAPIEQQMQILDQLKGGEF